jgi:hypothetical protein
MTTKIKTGFFQELMRDVFDFYNRYGYKPNVIEIHPFVWNLIFDEIESTLRDCKVAGDDWVADNGEHFYGAAVVKNDKIFGWILRRSHGHGTDNPHLQSLWP